MKIPLTSPRAPSSFLISERDLGTLNAKGCPDLEMLRSPRSAEIVQSISASGAMKMRSSSITMSTTHDRDIVNPRIQPLKAAEDYRNHNFPRVVRATWTQRVQALGPPTAEFVKRSGWLLLSSSFLITAGITRIVDPNSDVHSPTYSSIARSIPSQNTLIAYGWVWLVIGVLLLISEMLTPDSSVDLTTIIARVSGIIGLVIGVVSATVLIPFNSEWTFVFVAAATMAIHGLLSGCEITSSFTSHDQTEWRNRHRRLEVNAASRRSNFTSCAELFRRRITPDDQMVYELRTRFDANFTKDLSQVIVHRARANK